MEISIIIGPICSGKTTLLTTQYQRDITIDIGDIVRGIVKSEERVFNSDLDQRILIELRTQIRQAVDEKKNIVIVGIRQLSILLHTEVFIKALQLSPKNKIQQYSRIYLQVDKSERKRRFEQRVAEKDQSFTFEDIELRDYRIGLQQLTNYCLIANHQNTTIIKNI